MKPRLLDLFCGAGGASDGYVRAGFVVTGVDINPMPRYPYQFKQGDALEYLERYGHEYDAIHASPPCQDYTGMRAFVRYEYPRLIEPVRELLKASGKPYIIENVEGARSELCNPVTLCGVMFPHLRVYRHRLFESNLDLKAPYVCDGNHYDNTPPAGAGKSNRGYISITSGGIRGVSQMERFNAMGIGWMTNNELTKSIPPDYTHWLGAQVMEHLGYKARSCPKVRAEQLSLWSMES